jgi:phosphoserine phosphatase
LFSASLSDSQFYNAPLFYALCRAKTVITDLSRSQLSVLAQPDPEQITPSVLNWHSSSDESVRTDTHTRIVVTAESLNLEKVWQLVQVFDGVVSLGHIELATSGHLSIAKLAVSSGNTEGLHQLRDSLSQQYQVEIAVLSEIPDLNQPGILLMDMDSTVIQVECIDEIARLADIGEQVASVTELAMQGKLDFAESLHKRVACLAGIDECLLRGIRDRLPLMPGITALLTEMKKRGWVVAIASGGFTYFADYLKDRLALDFAISNQLGIADGKLTGKVQGDIVDAQVKARTLTTLMAQYGIEQRQTIAIGDGANDLTMMSAAGLGVAFHAKPVVRAQADCAIQYGGLDTVLAYLS